MTQNSPARPPTSQPPAPPDREGPARGVSDTLSGLNLRLGDNLAQVVAGLVGLGAGIIVGLLWPACGVLAGGILGLLAGVFLVGLFLALYRLIRR